MGCTALAELIGGEIPMRIIARVRNAYTDKFAVPRQPGLVPEVLTRIEFEPEYRNPDSKSGGRRFFPGDLRCAFLVAVLLGGQPRNDLC